MDRAVDIFVRIQYIYIYLTCRVTRLVGAYLAGVFVSDVLAYKSNSAGFKRGKVRRILRSISHPFVVGQR